MRLGLCAVNCKTRYTVAMLTGVWRLIKINWPGHLCPVAT